MKKTFILVILILIAVPAFADAKFVLNEYGGGFVSKNGLSFRYSDAGPDSFTGTNQSAINGKVYFELTFKASSGRNKATGFTNFGVTSDATFAARGGGFEGPTDLPCNDIEEITVCTYGAYNFQNNDKIKDGDVFGIAMDLDALRLYFSRNGKWIKGNPKKGTGGIELASGHRYEPAVSAAAPPGRLSENKGEKWIANFGKRGFIYSIPAGYQEFDGATTP